VFVQGCNFHCGYCQNPELITFDGHFDFSEKDVLDYITRRKNIIEAVVITGGEPAIHKDLPDFVRRVKALGFKVKLDTNGSRPGQLEYLLRDRLLDYVAIDIKTSFSKYSLLTGQDDIEEALSESIRLLILSTVPYEFRTTCAPGIVDEEDIRLMGKMIKGAKKCCLQQFRPGVTYDKNFRDIRPYSKNDLRRFQGILEDFVETVELRGI